MVAKIGVLFNDNGEAKPKNSFPFLFPLRGGGVWGGIRAGFLSDFLRNYTKSVK